MRRTSAGLIAAVFVLALGAPAFARVETVKGTLVDEGCYIADKANTGQKHAMKNGPMDGCATLCAKMGLPVTLLTQDGKMYLITGDFTARKNEKLVPHMAHVVELTGNVTADKDGSMNIAVTSLKVSK
jgi:hypothetical protein